MRLIVMVIYLLLCSLLRKGRRRLWKCHWQSKLIEKVWVLRRVTGGNLVDKIKAMIMEKIMETMKTMKTMVAVVKEVVVMEVVIKEVVVKEVVIKEVVVKEVVIKEVVVMKTVVKEVERDFCKSLKKLNHHLKKKRIKRISLSAMISHHSTLIMQPMMTPLRKWLTSLTFMACLKSKIKKTSMSTIKR